MISPVMIRLVTDPAIVDTPTLAVFIKSKEWYYWREGWKIRCIRNTDPDYRKDVTRVL